MIQVPIIYNGIQGADCRPESDIICSLYHINGVGCSVKIRLEVRRLDKITLGEKSKFKGQI